MDVNAIMLENMKKKEHVSNPKQSDHKNIITS